MAIKDSYLLARGRINRTTFWLRCSTIISTLLSIVFFAVVYGDRAGVIRGSEALIDTSRAAGIIVSILFFICLPAAVYSMGCIMGQRYHDFGMRNLWFLGGLPYIGSLCLLGLALWPGDKSDNHYGQKPAPRPLYMAFIAALFFAFSCVLLAGIMLELENIETHAP